MMGQLPDGILAHPVLGPPNANAPTVSCLDGDVDVAVDVAVDSPWPGSLLLDGDMFRVPTVSSPTD